jgi:hypothetical protein
MILSKQENALARSERIRRRPRTAASLAALVSAAALAGCASGRAPSDGAMYGAATSEMAVRGFLDGANTDDYGRMADLFGTADGPAVARFGETDIEQRMIFLTDPPWRGSERRILSSG